MPQLLSRTPYSLLLIILLLCAHSAAAATDAACNGLSVNDAWVPAAPPGAPVMAAYFKATNTGDTAIKLTAVTSPDFARAHIHQTVVDDSGTASMHAVDDIALSAGKTVNFGPGGYHVMLFEPERAVTKGDSVTLALHCGAADTSLKVTAKVRDRMATQMHMPDHEHMDHDH